MEVSLFDYNGVDFLNDNSPDIFTFIRNILKHRRPCGNLDRHGRIDFDRIREMLKTHTFSDMKTIECMLDNEIFIRKLSRDFQTFLDHQQQAFFKKGRMLGSGTNGEAFVITVDDNIKLVCKTPVLQSSDPHVHEKINNDSLIEYFIGVTVANQFRKFCPTFCYTLGNFKCGKGDDKTLCGINDPIKPYILLEFIEGRDIGELKELPEFLSCMIQLLLALEIAQREARFCHYDLSILNIMVTNAAENFDIALDDSLYQFNSKRAVIIDYGMTSVTYKSKLVSLIAGGRVYGKDSEKHSYLVQGFDILYILTSMLSFCESYEIRSYIKSYIFEKFIYRDLGRKDDPYKIRESKPFVQKLRFPKDYCGEYARSDLAQITPGMLLECMLKDAFTQDKIKGKITRQPRRVLEINPLTEITVNTKLNRIYRASIQPRLECIVPENFTSYMLITEAMGKIDRTVNLYGRLLKFRDENTDTLKKIDDKMLSNLARMVIEHIENDAKDILNLNKKSYYPEQMYIDLQGFLNRSVFIQFVEYYMKIYFLIEQLGLQTVEPYSSFITAFPTLEQVKYYKNYGTLVMAARRWAITLAEQRVIHVRKSDIHAVLMEYRKNKIEKGLIYGEFALLYPKKEGPVMYFITERSLTVDHVLRPMTMRGATNLIISTDGVTVWEIKADKVATAPATVTAIKQDIALILSTLPDIEESLQRQFNAFGLRVSKINISRMDSFKILV